MNLSYGMPRRVRAALRLLLNVGFVVFSLLALLCVAEPPVGVDRLACSVCLGAGFPLLALLFLVLRPALSGRPMVTMGEIGITDDFSTDLLSLRRRRRAPISIRWDEIESVTQRSWCGLRFLAVHPRDLQALINREDSPVLRAVLMASQRIYGAPFGVWQVVCAEPLPQLERLINGRITSRVKA